MATLLARPDSDALRTLRSGTAWISEARFCSKCGAALEHTAPEPARFWLWVKSFGWLLRDALTWPLRHRQERIIRWLTEASGPDYFRPWPERRRQAPILVPGERNLALRFIALAHTHDR
jgi:hypothetical protein